MPKIAPAVPTTRYRDSLAAALGAALSAGLVVTLIDVLVTRSRSDGSSPGVLALLALSAGLYALPALAAGLVAGTVAGSFRATYGHGALGRFYGRLARDRQLDIQLTGALMAAAVVALMFVLATSILAMSLVAEVERKTTGALLLGLVLVALVPVLAMLGWPVYRLTRRMARLVPRLGPVPACLGMVALAAVAGLGMVLFFVFTRLEWRALDLGVYALIAVFALWMPAWLWLWYGPLERVRLRVPARANIVVAAAAVAVILPLVTLRGQPDPLALAALTERSPGARVLVTMGRALIDRDGDGFSAFLGGPDCDDRNPAVNPDAREIADNGIDDNCLGGDRIGATQIDAAQANAAPTNAAPTATTPTKAAHTTATVPLVDNVVVILIDTVRADRLGVAGYRRDDRSLTPRMDELAGRSAYFTHAYAQAPNTPRSVPSIFTSRFPSQIQVEKKLVNFPRVLDENLTMFEVLQGAGIHTVGFASHFYFIESRNIAQGFDQFDNEGALDIKGSNHDTAAPRIVPKVTAKLAELAREKRRFAMFVHLFEPHSTYMAHDEFPITERGIPGLVQKYDYEIAFTDIWVGRILDAIEQNQLSERTMVLIFSDHGEAFGLHRAGGKKMFFHGQTLYDELLRVPLVIHMPGHTPGQDAGMAPATIDDQVMLVDIAPTVVEAMGASVPPRFVGKSLIARMQGKPMAPRPVFAELLPAPSWKHSARMMIAADRSHKLVHYVSERRFELFDMARDPDERIDVAAQQPGVLATLQNELTRWVEEDLQ